MIGVGQQAFKGLVQVGGGDGREGSRSDGGNGRERKADATAFWTLYNTEGKGAGVPLEVAKDLAGNGDWAAAFILAFTPSTYERVDLRTVRRILTLPSQSRPPWR